jgi:diguanylate cyclase (GGDEF)-like protein
MSIPHHPDLGDEPVAAILESITDAFVGLDPDWRVTRLNAEAERLLGRPRDEIAAAPAWGAFPDTVVARLWRENRRAGDGPIAFEEYSPTLEAWLEVRAFRLPDGGLGVFLRDVSDLRRVERELRASEAAYRALATEHAALRRVATAVAAEATPERTFALVATEAAELVGASCGYVARCEEHVAMVVGVSGDRDHVGEEIALTGEGVVSRVHATGSAARVPSYQALPADDPEARAARAHGVRSGVGAPVRVFGRQWGVVGVATSDPLPLPETAEHRLTELAELVGLSIANAEARALLAQEAITDALTGLSNQRAFHQRLGAEVARARRHGHPLGLVLLDLDRFKEINDTRGHLVGDRVLAQVGACLGRLVRGGEMLARVGGEEFAWILPATGTDGAFAVAERARLGVAEADLGDLGRLTISAGACELEGEEEPEALLSRADALLYRAKAGGRNRTVRP